jgi:2-polyprenyl-3-methyl-5-hydroxy-6-metoxy-1,4-benzoquinol methylase
MDNTDDHWKRWGEQDPYFAVLSERKFRRDNFEVNRKEFFESGAEYFSGILATAVRCFGQLASESALDFGSGVGRITIPLAQYFKKVIGVEISEAMIGEAKQNCLRFAVQNVDFVKSDDQLSRISQKFDFINSCLVLQHLPLKRGMNIIARLLKLLNPGGVIALHFPVRRHLPPLAQVVYFLQHNVPLASHFFNSLKGRRTSEPLMQMNPYDLVDVITLYSANGIREFSFQTHITEGTTSVILIGRKEAPSDGVK